MKFKVVKSVMMVPESVSVNPLHVIQDNLSAEEAGKLIGMLHAESSVELAKEMWGEDGTPGDSHFMKFNEDGATELKYNDLEISRGI